MELTESRKTWLIETAKALKGSDRRRFMARSVKELGRGGQRLATKFRLCFAWFTPNFVPI